MSSAIEMEVLEDPMIKTAFHQAVVYDDVLFLIYLMGPEAFYTCFFAHPSLMHHINGVTPPPEEKKSEEVKGVLQVLRRLAHAECRLDQAKLLLSRQAHQSGRRLEVERLNLDCEAIAKKHGALWDVLRKHSGVSLEALPKLSIPKVLKPHDALRVHSDSPTLLADPQRLTAIQNEALREYSEASQDFFNVMFPIVGETARLLPSYHFVVQSLLSRKLEDFPYMEACKCVRPDDYPDYLFREKKGDAKQKDYTASSFGDLEESLLQVAISRGSRACAYYLSGFFVYKKINKLHENSETFAKRIGVGESYQALVDAQKEFGLWGLFTEVVMPAALKAKCKDAGATSGQVVRFMADQQSPFIRGLTTLWQEQYAEISSDFKCRRIKLGTNWKKDVACRRYVCQMTFLERIEEKIQDAIVSKNDFPLIGYLMSYQTNLEEKDNLRVKLGWHSFRFPVQARELITKIHHRNTPRAVGLFNMLGVEKQCTQQLEHQSRDAFHQSPGLLTANMHFPSLRYQNSILAAHRLSTPNTRMLTQTFASMLKEHQRIEELNYQRMIAISTAPVEEKEIPIPVEREIPKDALYSAVVNDDVVSLMVHCGFSVHIKVRMLAIWQLYKTEPKKMLSVAEKEISYELIRNGEFSQAFFLRQALLQGNGRELEKTRDMLYQSYRSLAQRLITSLPSELAQLFATTWQGLVSVDGYAAQLYREKNAPPRTRLARGYYLYRQREARRETHCVYVLIVNQPQEEKEDKIINLTQSIENAHLELREFNWPKDSEFSPVCLSANIVKVIQSHNLGYVPMEKQSSQDLNSELKKEMERYKLYRSRTNKMRHDAIECAHDMDYHQLLAYYLQRQKHYELYLCANKMELSLPRRQVGYFFFPQSLKEEEIKESSSGSHHVFVRIIHDVTYPALDEEFDLNQHANSKQYLSCLSQLSFPTEGRAHQETLPPFLLSLVKSISRHSGGNLDYQRYLQYLSYEVPPNHLVFEPHLETLLHLAIRYRSMHCLHYLVLAGADFEMKNHLDKSAWMVGKYLALEPTLRTMDLERNILKNPELAIDPHEPGYNLRSCYRVLENFYRENKNDTSFSHRVADSIQQILLTLEAVLEKPLSNNTELYPICTYIEAELLQHVRRFSKLQEAINALRTEENSMLKKQLRSYPYPYFWQHPECVQVIDHEGLGLDKNFVHDH